MPRDSPESLIQWRGWGFYKGLLKSQYGEKSIKELEEGTEGYLWGVIPQEANWFLRHLPEEGAKILDLGSGPGVLAGDFTKAQVDVLCLDFSDAMVQRCQEKGLKA